MLYVFQSKADSDILMVSANAKAVLKILGKDENSAGILTVVELKKAQFALLQAVKEEENKKQTQKKETVLDEADADEMDENLPTNAVSLKQRVQPLLGMIEKSLAQGVPIVWQLRP